MIECLQMDGHKLRWEQQETQQREGGDERHNRGVKMRAPTLQI